MTMFPCRDRESSPQLSFMQYRREAKAAVQRSAIQCIARSALAIDDEFQQSFRRTYPPA